MNRKIAVFQDEAGRSLDSGAANNLSLREQLGARQWQGAGISGSMQLRGELNGTNDALHSLTAGTFNTIGGQHTLSSAGGAIDHSKSYQVN